MDQYRRKEKICNTGHKQNINRDKSGLIHFLLKTVVQQVL